MKPILTREEIDALWDGVGECESEEAGTRESPLDTKKPIVKRGYKVMRWGKVLKRFLIQQI